tara:strand:+ start:839 stop:1162 length:324 start_codon:yes stop_codon:yes gene_type:complete
MNFDQVIRLLTRKDQIAAIHNKKHIGFRTIECYNGVLIMEFDADNYFFLAQKACRKTKLHRIVTTISEPLEEIQHNYTNKQIYNRDYNEQIKLNHIIQLNLFNNGLS